MKNLIAVIFLSAMAAPAMAAGGMPQLGPANVAAAAPKLGALPGETVAAPPLTIATPGAGQPWSKSLSVPLPGLGTVTASGSNSGRGGSHTLKVQITPN